MLAAHRDQENLVHSHQVPTKQAPKTPGARFPKTPLKKNDENAPAGLTGKVGKMTKGKGIATPMQPQSRAPLGAKTTNAKARNAQTPGGAKGFEKTQLKPTAQKPKPKSTLQIEVKPDQDEGAEDGEEPEYAPPRVAELPYESDILPRGGLTFEGLKKENLFRGYYETFINPVDEDGVSRQDKRFKDEMTAVMDKAAAKNEKDLEEITWNAQDMKEIRGLLKVKPDEPEVAEAKMARKVRGQPQPSTVRSRKAAGALAAPPPAQQRPIARPQSAAAPARPARRPLSTLIAGRAATKPAAAAKPSSTGNAPAAAASRTTLGYNKGKSASSVVHSHARSQSAFAGHTTRTPAPPNEDENLTITPARARQAANSSANGAKPTRPAFMSIFDDTEDEDLPPMSGPQTSDDEDEEFELKLDL